jgi:hypothetical protein
MNLLLDSVECLRLVRLVAVEHEVNQGVEVFSVGKKHRKGEG